ncbi:Fur family transcriptional regulator, peroxide stress response regulator [Desulfuromusa kysingii]|uniref:Fur family transcriptional regulator, peroxide stress response regulator n=1 Tax=Desulfuromusa kysingii TaxID=37625 RepID=A0A1H4CB42_9BACT|nr:Fur family transcriptional regulator [Desulfuromusa kysingii]SEA57596.1 Fur family transcriptional regulator, peroxide stress response regulator [Desulfuromusa kysingii]
MDLILSKRLELFTRTCREKDLRITPQRLEIFKQLALAVDHPSAEKLHQRLLERMPTLSLDTVYRTLGTFLELGLISKVETVESQAHFEVAEMQHHHLICQKCKKIIDFEWKQVDEADLPDEIQLFGNFKRKSVVVYGTCRECME